MKLGKNIIKWGLGLFLTGCLTAPVLSSVGDKPFFRAASIVIVFGASDFQDSGGEAPIVFDFHVLDNATSGQAAPDLIGANGKTINLEEGQFNSIQDALGSGLEFQINNETFGGNFISARPAQTLDARDSYTAFGLDNTTDVDLLGNTDLRARFFVASNVPFDIFGQASNLETSGDFSALDYSNIRYRFRYLVTGGSGVARWGLSAQDPAPSGTGVTYGRVGNVSLDGMVGAPLKVFQGERRTARTQGSILDHAVGFQSLYNLTGSVDRNNYDFSQGIGSIAADVIYTIYTP